MGGLISKLTKPGVQDTSGNTTFYDNPGQQAVAFARQSHAPTSVADLPDLLGPDDSAPPATGNAQADADLPPVAGPGPKPTFKEQPTAQPKMVKPSLKELDQNPDGTPAPIKPGMTKLGALVSVLKAAGEGAMAGRAASERTVAATGGRRSAGFGTGFEAAETEPLERAGQRNALEQQELQTEIERQNAQPVSTPYGPMPLWKASKYAQLNRDVAAAEASRFKPTRGGGVFDTATQGYVPGTQPQSKAPNQSPQQVYADAVKGAMNRGLTGADLMSDPNVQAALAALKAAQPDRQQGRQTPDQQYLDAASRGDTATMRNIENMWRTKGLIGQEYRGESDDKKDKPKAPTRGEYQAAEVRKNTGFDKLEAQYRYDPESQSYVDDKTGNSISADEFNAKKQRVQNNYEDEVAALTGQRPPHVDLTNGGAQPSSRGSVPALKKGAAAKKVAAAVDVSKATRAVRNPQTGAVAYLVGNQWYDKNGAPLR